MGFFDGYVERRIRKHTFFKKINTIIDWSGMEKEILKVYRRGHPVDGRPAYKGLLLFKMLLIGIWYDLSVSIWNLNCPLRLNHQLPT